MDSGDFERGQLRKARSTCSLMFQGNIEIQGKLPAEDFSEVMPVCMRDSAFVDRIYGMIPGWEMPKIGQSEVHLTGGYGLITDYFCEIMHELRKESFVYNISQKVELDAEGGSLSIRDQKAIHRLASGMMKILSPHDSRNTEALEISVQTAVDYRQTIHEWLCTLSPGEFKPKKIIFKIKEA